MTPRVTMGTLVLSDEEREALLAAQPPHDDPMARVLQNTMDDIRHRMIAKQGETMKDEITRNDRMFLQVSKERAALRRQFHAYAKVISAIEGMEGFFPGRGGRSKLTNPVAVDGHTPAILQRVAPLFDGLIAEEEALKADMADLKDRLEKLDKLIEAYHDGEDILIAKLSL